MARAQVETAWASPVCPEMVFHTCWVTELKLACLIREPARPLRQDLTSGRKASRRWKLFITIGRSVSASEGSRISLTQQ